MVYAADEQQSVMDLYIRAYRRSIWKVLFCLPPAKGEGRRSAASLHLDILQTLAGVLLVCPWAEISKGAVGLCAVKLCQTADCFLSGAEHTLLQTLIYHGRAVP